MIEAMNNQFTRERQNEAIYRALADALRVIGYNGTAGWLDSQADGEGKHARRIAHYLTDKGVAVAYAGLEAVTVTVTGMGDAMAAGISGLSGQADGHAPEPDWQTREQTREQIRSLRRLGYSVMEIGDQLRLDRPSELAMIRAVCAEKDMRRFAPGELGVSGPTKAGPSRAGRILP